MVRVWVGDSPPGKGTHRASPRPRQFGQHGTFGKNTSQHRTNVGICSSYTKGLKKLKKKKKTLKRRVIALLKRLKKKLTVLQIMGGWVWCGLLIQSAPARGQTVRGQRVGNVHSVRRAGRLESAGRVAWVSKQLWTGHPGYWVLPSHSPRDPKVSVSLVLIHIKEVNDELDLDT